MPDAIYWFCESFRLVRKVTATYHHQSNVKAEKVIQKLRTVAEITIHIKAGVGQIPKNGC